MYAQVQDGASEVFGPILERSAKAERIRSVQLLLRRFQGLFSAPQRISAHAAARDFEQVRGNLMACVWVVKYSWVVAQHTTHGSA